MEWIVYYIRYRQTYVCVPINPSPTHTQALSTSVPRRTNDFYRGFPLTTTLSEATTTHTSDSLPTYRVMDEGGVVIDPQQDPKVA